MARLPRLTVPGNAHLVLQRGHPAAPVFGDGEDVDAYLLALHEAARELRVAVHAFGFASDELRLLVTPSDAPGLSKLMQAVARRHAAWLARRHGRRGTPWQGRFASTPVEAGPGLFEVMRFVEMDGEPGLLSSSVAHHRGLATLRGLTDPAGYWALGNTPFEREVAYGLVPSPAAERASFLRSAAFNGWPVGSPGFSASVVGASGRAAGPARRGRPRKSVADP